MTFDTILVGVSDLARAKDFYQALFGAAPVADSEYYVGFQLGGVHFGLAPNQDVGGAGAVPYLVVDDIAATIHTVTEHGGSLQQPAADVAQGLQVAVVSDPDGNSIGLKQYPVR